MDWLSWFSHPDMANAGLAGLFVASFLSATLLPGGSEAVLLGVIALHPGQALPALLLATAGNTLGGMTTYWMGRALPEKKVMRSGIHPDGAGGTVKHIEQVRRWGSPALLLAWAPLIGDALCAAAGWLRLHWLPCLLWMALGKGARYAVLVFAAT
jgi:membrane protein YqaA with SNARE-associated domain